MCDCNGRASPAARIRCVAVALFHRYPMVVTGRLEGIPAGEEISPDHLNRES